MIRFSSRFLSLLLAAVLSLAVACSSRSESGTPESTDLETPPAGETDSGPSYAELVPYGAEPWPGIVTGGQPSVDDLTALRDAGLRTVINLRVPTERGTRDEPEWAENLGLAYVSIPVQGKAGLTEEAARLLDRALEDSDRPVLVHCGSSNRVGALFALRAFHLEGMEPGAALAVGRSAGVTKLAGTVEELLAAGDPH